MKKLICLILLVLVLIFFCKSYRENLTFPKERLKAKCLTNNYMKLPTGGISRSRDYDVAMARYLLALSYNVEISNCENLGDIPLPPGFETKVKIMGTSFLGIKRMFAYFFYSERLKTCLLVFSGTFFDDEWVKDLEMKQVPASNLNGYKEGVEIHKGFYNIYESLQNVVRSVVNRYVDIDSQLIISGHSLGAALGTIAAYDLYAKDPVIYTFASPRVFNIGGVHVFDEVVNTSYRIYNTADIFTTIPIPVFGKTYYEHVKNGVGFTKNLKLVPYNHTDAYLEHFGLPQRTS